MSEENGVSYFIFEDRKTELRIVIQQNWLSHIKSVNFYQHARIKEIPFWWALLKESAREWTSEDQNNWKHIDITGVEHKTYTVDLWTTWFSTV